MHYRTCTISLSILGSE